MKCKDKNNIWNRKKFVWEHFLSPTLVCQTVQPQAPQRYYTPTKAIPNTYQVPSRWDLVGIWYGFGKYIILIMC